MYLCTISIVGYFISYSAADQWLSRQTRRLFTVNASAQLGAAAAEPHDIRLMRDPETLASIAAARVN